MEIKEFVPYDRSLKLKKLGCNEPCFASYKIGKILMLFPETVGYRGHEFKSVKNSGMNSNVYPDMIWKEECTAPTFSQAFRWFRNDHNLGHEISCPYSSTHFGKNVKIINGGKFEAFITDEEQLSFTDEDFLHGSYEEAELACLDKLIEIVELKQKSK